MLCILVWGLFSCKKENSCLHSVGNIQPEKREVSNFYSLMIESDIDVELIQDTVSFITVISGKNIIPHIETEVKNGQLLISNRNKCNFLRKYDYEKKVEVHFISLTNIEIDGHTGKLYASDTIQADTLYMNIRNAASEIDLTLKAAKIKIDNHNGVSDLLLKGYSELAYYYHHGYGRYDALNLYADQIYAWNNNTGDLLVYTNNLLDVQITYTGDVYYKGNPAKIIQRIKSSGKLIKWP